MARASFRRLPGQQSESLKFCDTTNFNEALQLLASFLRTASVRSLAMVTDALGATLGLESLTWMSSEAAQQVDGFTLPVTTLTVMLASGLDPALRARQGSGIGRSAIRLIDPRDDSFSKSG